ncbi:hypothetical protein RIR_jg20911.t1 [Rhizophagus irregularis DAOM 181602=DAOM 197198]|uniref:Uncharacterized protein n=1 Tax=Rhizophagus irregularis (strain DAOM 181602 / DAOM 197198 / MUCL 43194) TaxID=747089 RepID=U9U180_RHIID|nr:hypothetical protein RIR_jg20911.t1 [Rhizophagus irregularis DAOM 181602=DAOM 197198]
MSHDKRTLLIRPLFFIRPSRNINIHYVHVQILSLVMTQKRFHPSYQRNKRYIWVLKISIWAGLLPLVHRHSKIFLCNVKLINIHGILYQGGLALARDITDENLSSANNYWNDIRSKINEASYLSTVLRFSTFPSFDD